MSLGRVYVRAPNHLGDGVMARAAIAALAAASARVVVAAPPFGPTLYRDLGVAVVERGHVPPADVAVLFAPSFRAAWEARGVRRRVGLTTDRRGLLLTDRVRPLGGHRSEDYAALVEAIGVEVGAAPPYLPTDDERRDVEVPDQHTALVPLSPSGATVMWTGFEVLGGLVPHPVVYTGPGEHLDTRHQVIANLPLGQLAAHFERAAVVVSNDSGLSHFARAVGIPTVVVFGSTVPAQTGAGGSTAVEGPSPSCRPCYRKRCSRPTVECLDIPVERVLAAVEELRG